MTPLDRLPERAALSQLLDTARAGRSGVLVMRGEPGVGKTALLEYAIESAAGLRVWFVWHKTAIPEAEEAYAGSLEDRGEEGGMSQPTLNNPDARYWDDLVDDFDFTTEEKLEIREGTDRMIAEVRARRLAEVRKRQNATCVLNC